MRFVFKQPKRQYCSIIKFSLPPQDSGDAGFLKDKSKRGSWRECVAPEVVVVWLMPCTMRLAGSTGSAAPKICSFMYKQLFFPSKKVNFSHVWNESESSWSQQSIDIIPPQLSLPAAEFGLKFKQPRNYINPFCRWYGWVFIPGKGGNCLSCLLSWMPTVLWLLALETGQDSSRKFQQLSCKNHEEEQARLRGLHWVEFDHCLLYWHIGRGFVV